MRKTYKVIGDFYLSDGVWITEDIGTGFKSIRKADYFAVMSDLGEYQNVRIVEEKENEED